jgi:20S proteasome alpha/beta subunit
VLMILAGWNVLTKKPTLDWIDNLGTRADVPYGAHGYGAYYTMSIFDRYHRDDISYEEGLDIMRKCITELEKRLPVASGGYRYRFPFCVLSRCVDADEVGSRLLMRRVLGRLQSSWRGMRVK